MSTLPACRAPGCRSPRRLVRSRRRPRTARRPIAAAARRRHRPLRPRRRRLRQLGRPRARRRRPRGRRPQHARRRAAVPVPRRARLHALHRRAGAPGSAPGRSAPPPRSRSRRPPLLPGLVSSVAALCVALFVFGAATGMVNVAANAVGVAGGGAASAGRSCPGCTPGSASAASAARWSAAPPPPVLGVRAHLALVAAAGLFVSAWALPALLGAGRRRRGPAGARRPDGEGSRGRPPCSWCSVPSPAAPPSARAR